MKKLFIICLSLIAVSTACKKDNDTPRADTHFYIKNNIGQAAHVAIYTSQSDYNRSTNALVNADLAAGAVYDWKNADTTINYYYDWYTTDYAYSNWGVQRGYLYDTILKSNIPLCMLNIDRGGLKYQTAHGDTLSIEQAYYSDNKTSVFASNGNRQMFVNGNDTGSVWVSYDVIRADHSDMWNTLADTERYVKFILRKDLKVFAWYYNANGSGFVRSDSGYYYIGAGTANRKAYLTVSNASSLSWVHTNGSFLFAQTTASRPDTAMFGVGYYTYYLKRQ